VGETRNALELTFTGCCDVVRLLTVERPEVATKRLEATIDYPRDYSPPSVLSESAPSPLQNRLLGEILLFLGF
jgi:hypothetical protein